MMLYLLYQIQHRKYLFPEEPNTFGRVKRQYQEGDWRGDRIIPGGSNAGGLVVDGVDDARD